MKKVFCATLLFLCLIFPLMASAEKVNVNSADADTLASVLKGVGAEKARAIVAHREANGPFRSAEDLLQVQGIGRATLEANLDRIVVE